MSIIIREEEFGDREAVAEVNQVAFLGDVESKLVDALRASGHAQVSLVALIDESVIGHILFSDLAIHTSTETVPALALAPMSVVPDFQRRGIGSILVIRGLEVCRERGHRIVIVVGHRNFYPRFGFSNQLAENLISPYSGESFMAAELVPGALTSIEGFVEYPSPFHDL